MVEAVGRRINMIVRDNRRDYGVRGSHIKTMGLPEVWGNVMSCACILIHVRRIVYVMIPREENGRCWPDSRSHQQPTAGAFDRALLPVVCSTVLYCRYVPGGTYSTGPEAVKLGHWA